MNQEIPTLEKTVENNGPEQPEHPENRKVRIKLDGSETENPHILKLKKPLIAGDGERKLTELKLDCSALSGDDFLRYAREYRMRFNIGNTPNIIYDETFRATVIAAINGMPLEDFSHGTVFSDMIKATSRILYFFVD